MKTHFENLSSVQNIIKDYSGLHTPIYQAAVRLQLAILATMAADLRSVLPKRKPRLIDGLTPKEAKLASDRNGKIPAIKLVRERGFGLKEAKDLVEDWMEKHLGFRYWPNNAPRSEFKQYDAEQYQQARQNS